jgi:hypothetical protein
MSEAGVLDIFLLPGPQPLDVFKQLTTVVGRSHRMYIHNICNDIYYDSSA